jgi:hypothetical protein
MGVLFTKHLKKKDSDARLLPLTNDDLDAAHANAGVMTKKDLDVKLEGFLTKDDFDVKLEAALRLKTALLVPVGDEAVVQSTAIVYPLVGNRSPPIGHWVVIRDARTNNCCYSD